METRKLIVILADISGYTRFMLESRTAALHGQPVINGLIESILREVDIPLTLQDIEGDAVFLYRETYDGFGTVKRLRAAARRREARGAQCGIQARPQGARWRRGSIRRRGWRRIDARGGAGSAAQPHPAAVVVRSRTVAVGRVGHAEASAESPGRYATSPRSRPSQAAVAGEWLRPRLEVAGFSATRSTARLRGPQGASGHARGRCRGSVALHRSAIRAFGLGRFGGFGGRIQRSENAKDQFKREHACPSTGATSGSCPGFVIDPRCSMSEFAKCRPTTGGSG